MGTIANFFDNETEVFGLNTRNATAYLAFTPGVNGDYAYPQLNYVAIQNQDLYTSSTNRNFSVSFEDHVEPYGFSQSLQARSSGSYVTTFDVNDLTSEGVNSFGVALRGFALEMECIEAHQPEGSTCNSNGIWPYNVSLNVGDCTFHAGNGTLDCKVDLQLDRAWTPSEGGGKSLNQVMDYTATLYFTILGGMEGKVDFHYPSAIVEHSTLYSDPVNKTHVFTLPQNSNLTEAFSVFSGFGFEFVETSGFTDLGRYMESFTFFLDDLSYDGSSQLKVQSVMGITAPKTVFPSNTILRTQPMVVRMASMSTSSQVGSVFGSVCVDDATFKCGLRGLPQQTSTSVPFSVPLS
eukprot:CAMPEP_0201491390 /NCGR_PEP_ID=MMETSP0151_2-20130828/29672_1 /ASSEMBLY_ACC=CAM_ASM_000257 /TAXON_ID=200890 /ORGANISM="Paramoeba atlantica, Strain 621/1 / CCAP 1560/9" /LENGTH=349 /DNA_ID=CAMNT_0047877729 /DNA_START=188 /DNA_END=1237 /DNA_ORIENTATION=+